MPGKARSSPLMAVVAVPVDEMLVYVLEKALKLYVAVVCPATFPKKKQTLTSTRDKNLFMFDELYSKINIMLNQ
jgi:hypothetical protein